MTLALLLVDLEQRGSAETLQNPVLNTSTGVHPCVKFGGACGLALRWRAPGELVLWRFKRGRRWVLKSSRDPTCFFLLSFVCLCESVCVCNSTPLWLPGFFNPIQHFPSVYFSLQWRWAPGDALFNSFPRVTSGAWRLYFGRVENIVSVTAWFL